MTDNKDKRNKEIKKKKIDANTKNNEKINLSQKEKFLVAFSFFIFLIIIMAIVILLSLRVNTSSVKGCENISNMNNRNECLTNLATSSGNYSICNLLPTNSTYKCEYTIAYSSKNVDECSKIGNNQYYTDCVYNLTNSSNSKVCFSSKNLSLTSECATKLEDLSNYSVDYCNYMNSSDKYNCSIKFNFKRATENVNSAYCSDLPNVTSNDTDVTSLSDVMPQSIINNESLDLYLMYYSSNLTYQDICKFSLYTITKDRAYCSGLPTNFSRICYIQPNVTAINVTAIKRGCSEEPAYYNICMSSTFYGIANETGNLTYCKYVTNATYKNMCDSLK